MKRLHEDIIDSDKRRKEQHITPVCVGRKRHHEDNYDSQFSQKKSNVGIQGPIQTSSHGQSKPGMYNI